MPVTRTVAAALVGVIVLGIGGATAWGDITVQSWSLKTMAQAGVGPGSEVIDTMPSTPPPWSPWSVTRIVGHSGEGGTSNAFSHYDFSAVGDVGSFYSYFDHNRGEPYMSQAQSCGDLFFTGDMGLIYSLEGSYTLYDGYQSISLSVVLEDLTAGIIVFEDYQATVHTSGSAPVFTLNGSGTLVAGHDYRLGYDYWINASEGPDGGAYAEGSLEMNLTPIPTPGAALLGVIGLGTVACARRRIA